MKDNYLLSMEVAGIKNIEKPVRLSFYKKTIDKNFDPKEYRVKSIYGANGTGKTGLIYLCWKKAVISVGTSSMIRGLSINKSKYK